MSWSEDSAKPVLTHRECEILELVANGYSAKEVASHFGIAPRTVEGHIDSVRMKLRARNRAHMITQAVMEGLLHIPAEPADHKRPRLIVTPACSHEGDDHRPVAAQGQPESDIVVPVDPPEPSSSDIGHEHR